MKRRPNEFELDPNVDLKNYRFIGAELEALGNRLDAARLALDNATTDWARWYWQESLDRLLFQWRTKIAMYDGHGRDNSTPKWTVDYYFYETPQEISSYGLTDRVFDQIFKTSLDESWERARQSRLDRCNCV